jgi:hypothetical protein
MCLTAEGLYLHEALELFPQTLVLHVLKVNFFVSPSV